MMGAAVATVIGQILSAVLAAAYLLHMKADAAAARAASGCGVELHARVSAAGHDELFVADVSIVFSMAAVLNMCRKYGALDPVFGQAQYAQIPTAVVGIVMKFFQIVISIAIGLAAGCIPDRRVQHRRRAARPGAGAAAPAAAGRGGRGRSWRRCCLRAARAVFADLFGAKNESAYYTDFAVRCIRWFLGAAALSCVNKGAMIYLQALGKAWTSTALSLLREIVLRRGARAAAAGVVRA